MAVNESPRPDHPRGDRSAFLTEVAVGRPRAPSRLGKVDEQCTDEGVRPAEKALAPQPPSPSTARRTSTDSRRRSTRSGADGVHPASATQFPPVRSIRSLMQKAAQKTILVVRTKNAMQAAEAVTIRFNAATPTDLPRVVQLPQLIDKVFEHVSSLTSASSKPKAKAAAPPLFSTRRHVREFRDEFLAAPEVDALLKDLFWLTTSHLFQPGRHAEAEQRLFARIADSFTALFVRLQMPPALQSQANQQHQSVHARGKQAHAAARFLDALPDVVAQVLFASMYEAFPKSREALLGQGTQRAIRRLCFGWLGGRCASREGGDEDAGAAAFAHWLSVGQESPKRIAALSDFPAMRNRMLRAERVERTKLATRNRHAAAVAMASTSPSGLGSPGRPVHPRHHHHHHHHQDGNAHEPPGHTQDERMPYPTDAGAAGRVAESARAKPPPHRVNKPSQLRGEGSAKPVEAGGAFGVRVETRERCVFEMQNSPLVTSFLDRHGIGAGAGRLRVQLRLTSSSSSRTRPGSVSNAATDGDAGKESGRPSTTPAAGSHMGQTAVRLAPHAPRERRRRVADPAGFMLALAQIEDEGSAVRSATTDARRAARVGDALDRQRLAAAHRALDGEFGALRQHSARLHEFSNQLVSKKRIDAMLGASTAASLVTSGHSSAVAALGPATRPPLSPRSPRGAC